MKKSMLKKITAIVLTLIMVLPAITVVSGGAMSAGQDPIPENIGSTREYSGVKVSYTRVFEDASGVIPVGAGVGAHGAYETRIVRTDNGTYAAFITDATGEATAAHPGWNCGVATFSIVKITATGFERIFTAEYPQAQGSCTPNIVQGPNGIVYCVIIADDKDRRQTEYCNGVWLQVYKLDTATDTVTLPGGTQKYRHTTSPSDDHGYGYTQPIFDFEHGKMYALTCGGEAPGYLAWWVYNLETDRWTSTCHTVQLDTRRCYINGYADGNGGFSIVIQRCAPISALANFLGVQFTTTGYAWDALYFMHVANPNVNSFTQTAIALPNYTPEGYNGSGKNRIDTVSHYGNSGCTYLDDQDRIHVIYSHKIGNTKKTTVYHVVYDLVGTELYRETLSTTLVPKNGGSPTPKSFAMTQDKDGTYYVLCEMNSTSPSGAAIQLWKSNPNDGLSFTKLSTATTLQTPEGTTVGCGKFIIGNTRNYSENDGYVPLMFEGSSNGSECFYYTCIALPCAGSGAAPHTHTWNAGEVTTPPSCTAAGVRTFTCSGCGATYTESIPMTSHTWDEGILTTEPTYEVPGVITYTCTVCGAETTEAVPVLDPLPGDLNGDGKVNGRDFIILKKLVAGSITENDVVSVNSDVNSDGKISGQDIIQMKKILAGAA